MKGTPKLVWLPAPEFGLDVGALLAKLPGRADLHHGGLGTTGVARTLASGDTGRCTAAEPPLVKK